jgi:hypothetical protein
MDPNLLQFAAMARPGMGAPGAPMPSSAMQPPAAPYASPMPSGAPMGAQQPAPQQQPPMAPQMPPINPADVIRPVSGGMPGRAPQAMATAAQAGRGGDRLVAHMTPGEIAVPPQVQTPEVLAALNKAFAQAGANPTSYQAGSPDQKINPTTGMPEFGFFDILLPASLGILGSMFLGPEMLAPALESAGLGAGAAGVAGGAAGSFLGSTAGNMLTGKPLGEAAAMGAGSAIGSGIGNALTSGASTLGGLANGMGGSAIPDANVVDGIRNPLGDTMANLPGGGLSPSGLPLSTEEGMADLADHSGISGFMSRLGGTNLKNLAGSGLGGAIGSTVADSFFPPKSPVVNLGPHLPPPGPVSQYIGGGSPTLNAGVLKAGAPQFPTQQQLLTYGQSPQYNFFPT